MSEEWQELIRFAIYIIVSIAALKAGTTIFGVDALSKILKSILKAEFSTMSGIISFLGFVAFGYFCTNPTLFTHLTKLATPGSLQGEFSVTNPAISNTLIWALVLALFGNFALIAILKIYNK